MKKKILVIDDCDDLREIMTDILTEGGYQVESAADAEEGTRIFQSTRFDLVVCDLVLPMSTDPDIENEEGTESMDSAMVGIHSIVNFAKLNPTLPIVAISGQLTGAPLDAIRKFGAVSTLSKPFSRNEFLNKIAEVLSQSASPSVN